MLRKVITSLSVLSAMLSAAATEVPDSTSCTGDAVTAAAVTESGDSVVSSGGRMIMQTALALPVRDSIPELTLFDGQPNIYDMPYSLSGNYPNYHRLAGNTAVLVAGGAAALIILELLPENSTQWDRSAIKNVPFFQRYYNNVIRGPHWDGDKFFFNYVLHPYAGAAYFMSARSQGFNFWYSALYSFCISTFFWEYGVEAFMERPSIQDLIVTPVAGSIIGELFYRAKRTIVHNDYRLLGWKPLGYVTAFLLDPVNELLGYFRGNHAHGYTRRHLPVESSVTPAIHSAPGPRAGLAPGFTLTLTF